MSQVPACHDKRPNEESNTPFKYYYVNMCLSILDHFLNDIDVLFDNYGKYAMALTRLVASVKDILDIYSSYRPNLPHFNNEVIHWRRKCAELEVSSRPYRIAKALKHVTMKRIQTNLFFLRLLVPLQLINANVRDWEVHLSV